MTRLRLRRQFKRTSTELPTFRTEIMRLGPIVLMKQQTFDKLVKTQDFLSSQNARMSAELGAGLTTHSFMHYPWTAKTAPSRILEADKDDERSRQAAKRVTDAYQKAMQSAIEPAKCMWTQI